MSKTTLSNRAFNNSVEFSLDIIGGKWKTPILWQLKDNPNRYGELKKSLQKITHKMLTRQLRELEESGIIKRKVYPVVPPKVEYSLTDLGKTILPIIEGLNEWGSFYKSQNE
ncbi:MAG: helix-turn-helix transcriptional regulator [Ignavibacteriaceae bacterium]|nr:helix-turn-helix transcriptional regulator [Ignavibacteriaceae bacterium]